MRSHVATVAGGCGRRLRRFVTSADPLVAVLGLVSLVVYPLHGFDEPLTRDLGVYLYGGQRFLAGDPPYVGVLNRAGPLAHALPGVGIGLGRLVGLSDVHGARLFFMLIAVACVCLVYVVARDLTGSRAAAVVAAVAFLGFQGFLDLATDGPREKTAMVLFLLAAVLALVHRRWATCGVFIALGTLTWQPVFFSLVLAAGVAVLLAPERRRHATGRLVAGGAVTTGAVLLYYALEGALHTFLEGFVLINAEYTRQPSPWGDPTATFASLHAGFGPSLWVILVGLVAVPVLAVASVRPARRSRVVAPATWVALGAAWLGGVGWSSVAFNSWPDLFELLPLAAIGVGGLAELVLSRLRARTVVVAATVALALIGSSYAAVFAATTSGDGLPRQRAAVMRMVRMGPQPWTIVSIQAPQVLVITGRANPSPYQMFGQNFSAYVDDTFPGGLAGYVAWLGRQDPTYIVVQKRGAGPWLRPWLQEHYARVPFAHGFNLWVNRTTVSEDVRRTMKRLHGVNSEVSS